MAISPEQEEIMRKYIASKWDAECIPVLEEYIRIPCKSPGFDKEWATNGLLEKAMDLLVDWVDKQEVKGLKKKVFKGEGRTPFLYLEVPPTVDTTKTILMYGHMDKQPECYPWEAGLDPYTPVIRDGKLYGRAAADDGYSVMTAITSLVALQKAGLNHGRVVIVIEGCEESGSFDLPYFVNLLKADIGEPELIVCLDSGSMNYDQMWLTTSLRGVVMSQLKVKHLTEGIHSGIASGRTPDTFRIIRQLLNRVEDAETGEVLVPECHVAIPDSVMAEAKALNDMEGLNLNDDLPLGPGAKAIPGDNCTMAINNGWKPAISYTGVDGMPSVEDGGNVLRQETNLKLSIRIPPGVEPKKAYEGLKRVLEADPPYGATVELEDLGSGAGWAAPPLADWLKEGVTNASQQFFNKPSGVIMLGGSIPFMGMLGEMFPQAQFCITGILGPKSNAHGPNEFLEIAYTKGVSLCVASVVLSHFNQFVKQ